VYAKQLQNTFHLLVGCQLTEDSFDFGCDIGKSSAGSVVKHTDLYEVINDDGRVGPIRGVSPNLTELPLLLTELSLRPPEKRFCFGTLGVNNDSVPANQSPCTTRQNDLALHRYFVTAEFRGTNARMVGVWCSGEFWELQRDSLNKLFRRESFQIFLSQISLRLNVEDRTDVREKEMIEPNRLILT
jgi:hypothetical protein